MAAEARLDDDAGLHLSGRLDRDGVIALWPQLEGLRKRARHLVIDGVTSIDSAGLALLSTLTSNGLTLHGSAPGLDELAAAYRLDASLVLSPPLAPPA